MTDNYNTSIKISINEKVVDHERIRKERKIKIGANLFTILFMTMVLCHNISFDERTTNEAQTKETKYFSGELNNSPEISGSELVKAIITPNEKQILKESDLENTESEKVTEGEETITEISSTVEEYTIEESTTEQQTTEVPTTETTTEETTPDVETPVIVPDGYRYTIQTEEEWRVFTKCVEAEVTGDDPDGVDYDTAVQCKLHVAQVILNRVEHTDFPNNIVDVVYQPRQFSPVSDGRISTVEVSQSTIDACNLALLNSTEDTVYGSLYFRIGGDWSYLTKVFTDEVGHQFYTR